MHRRQCLHEISHGRVTNGCLRTGKRDVDFQPNLTSSKRPSMRRAFRTCWLMVHGIAGGMAIRPPHNLTESVAATGSVKNRISLSSNMKTSPGQTFPPRFYLGGSRAHESYLTGRGISQMRARAGIDRIGRGIRNACSVITEIPFQVNKSPVELIAELINEKKLDGFSDLRDESDRTGMRIVVELKRDAVPQIVLNKLYKLTPMQSSFGVINLAIVNGQPRVLNLKQMLECFVDFRREVVRRRTEYELRKARARAHILEGLTKAIDALELQSSR